MWRPEKDWVNPYKDHWGKKSPMTPKEDYETNQHFAYEAGADAMLGILRKQAIEYIDGSHIKLFGSPEWIEWQLGGLIVFIPDEEADDKV